MEILEVYKREYPDLFARLPLPKELAEKMGVPISDDVMPLSAYLKKHASLSIGPIDAIEERIACSVTPASEAKLPEPEKLEIKTITDITETGLNSGEVPQEPSAPKSGS